MTGIAVDGSGNVYAANNLDQILKITPGGSLSVIAGEGGHTSSPPVVGPATSSPLSPWQVAVDAAGNVYASNNWFSGPNAADQHLQVVKVATDGTLSIPAGTGAYGAPVPGTATSSPLGGDGNGLAVDALGNVYLGARWEDPPSDTPYRYFYGELLKITPAGSLSVIAGNSSPMTGPTVAGPATSTPVGAVDVAVDAWGSTYYTDYAHVVKISPTGHLSIIAGNLYAVGPPVPGYAPSSPLESEGGLAVGPTGEVFAGVGAGDNVSPANPRWIVGLTPRPFNTFVIVTPPSVTGTTRVGYRLYAHRAGLRPGAASFSYRWLRNGRPIYGATGSSYLLHLADRFQLISVRITYTRLTYRPLVQVAHAARRIS